jgi:hypothetical protein
MGGWPGGAHQAKVPRERVGVGRNDPRVGTVCAKTLMGKKMAYMIAKGKVSCQGPGAANRGR